MPNIEMLDLIWEIINAAPALHAQTDYFAPLDRWASSRAVDAVKQAAAAPEALKPYIEPVAKCGTAYCVAGWAMHLSGNYVEDTVSFKTKDGQWVDTIREAANILGINRCEAYLGTDSFPYYGIFYDNNTKEQIKAWIDYYKGLITKDELANIADSCGNLHDSDEASQRDYQFA